MQINPQQTATLLSMVAAAKPDEVDCDGCFDHMAEFVELELTGEELPEAMDKVRRHLDQCMCCNDEHNALLEALKSLG